MTSTAELMLWLVLPYVSLAVFVTGHVWRYRHDQFGWTSRSTQLFERRLLAWGSVLFHYGALAVIAGHVAGMLVPERTTAALGVSEHVYRLAAGVGGTLAGLVCLAGLALLTFRRATVARVRLTTSAVDLAVFALLLAIIALGVGQTIGYNLVGSGYDYRQTVGPWFRSLLVGPRPSLMAHAPLAYQVHAALPWLLYAIWPFSRLVHVWSYPIQYLGRPYILYRSRHHAGRRRIQTPAGR